MKRQGMLLLLGLASLYSPYSPSAHAQAAPLRMIETSPEFATRMLAEHPGVAHKIGANLLLVPQDTLADFSARVHELTGRCGGFMDITDESPASFIVPLDRDVVSKAANDLPQLGARKAEIARAIEDVRAANIESFVRLYSGSFKTRFAKSEEGVRAPRWLGQQWLDMATRAGRSDIRVELITPPPSYSQNSVRITIPGLDSSRPIVVLGAHLDSINRSSDAAPGVDDDGSGIAALTETYRVMLENGFRPKATVQIFGYAAEELGLLGSRAIAESYQAQQIQVRAALQLDMVSFPGESKTVTFIMDNVDQELSVWTQQLYGLYVGGDVKEERCGYGCSDHASWHRYGYRSAFPFEAPMNEMNHRIHTARDVWDEQLDADYSARFVKLAYAFAAELAN